MALEGICYIQPLTAPTRNQSREVWWLENGLRQWVPSQGAFVYPLYDAGFPPCEDFPQSLVHVEMGHPLSCTFGRGTPAVQDDQPDAYTYQPLPDGAIRILTLWGGNPDDPLTGILELTAVDDAGAYEPLSYVWGDNTLTHKIRLPTTELRITSSLYHALRRLRLRAEPRRVWADQICIDQANEAERSQQVQFMNRIYRGGSSIQVWLGLDEEHLAEEAFGFVRRLAGLLGDKRHPIFETASTDDLAEQSAWKPMKNITDHPWVSLINQARGSSSLYSGSAGADQRMRHHSFNAAGSSRRSAPGRPQP